MRVEARLAMKRAAPPGGKVDPRAVTAQDQTWRICYEKHLDFLSRYAEHVLPEYRDGMFRLSLPRMHLPTMTEINARIAPAGWSAVQVEGYLPGRTFYQFQAEAKLPIASNLRALVHADYSPQPDMLHDIFGHLPFTFAEDLMTLVRTIARAGAKARTSLTERGLYRARLALSTLKAMHDPDEAAMHEAAARVERFEQQALIRPGVFDRIRRVYAWAIEFGLLRVAGATRVLGAGLMSSREEFAKFALGDILLLPFDDRVLEHEIEISGHQKQLFVIDDLSQVYRVLDKAIEG